MIPTPKEKKMQKRNQTRATENVDTFMTNLMAQAAEKPLPELLTAAFQQGAIMGGRAARQNLVEALQKNVQDPLVAVFNFAKQAAPVKMKQLRSKPIIVCPVAGCTHRGIRPQHNFCKQHVVSLSPEKKEKLRAKQIEDRKLSAKKPTAADTSPDAG